MGQNDDSTGADQYIYFQDAGLLSALDDPMVHASSDCENISEPIASQHEVAVH